MERISQRGVKPIRTNVACHLHHAPSADRHFSTVVFVGLRLVVVVDDVMWSILQLNTSGGCYTLTTVEPL